MDAAIFSDYTVRTVSLGALTLGVASGVLGTFAVLRRQSLIGDAVSHAALPGIALAFLLSGSKSPIALLAGAAFTGVAGMLTVTAVTRLTRIKQDSALGLVLSVFFGWGIVLLTMIQKMPAANKAGLDHFLFGQAASLLREDVLVMAVLTGAALLAVGLLWKELKLISFDPEYAQSLGLPRARLEVGLTALITLAIVVGLQTVGVVLMSAMIIAPAAAARQWTHRLGVMVCLSAAFGALSGVTGALFSSTGARLPTGPLVVLCMTCIAIVSLFFGRARGLIWARIMRQRRGQQIAAHLVLQQLRSLELQHEDSPAARAHATRVVELMVSPRANVRAALERLARRGQVDQIEPGQWALTPAGRQALELAEGELPRLGAGAER